MSGSNEGECKNCSRRDALNRLFQLGISVITIGAVAGCPGGSKWGKTGATHNSGVSGEEAAGSVRINKADLPVGSAARVDPGGRSAYLVHLSEDEWIALDRKCTHKGTLINFQPDKGEFLCPNHKSRFSLDGKVLRKPAKEPLNRLVVNIGSDYVEVTTG